MAEEVKFIFNMDDQFSAKAKQAEASVSGLQSKLSGMGGLVASAFGTAAIIGFGKSVIDSLKNYEYFHASIKTMLHGNINMTTALENQLQQLAKTTPFELKDVQESTKQLMAYGFQAGDVTGTLRTLGDISSGVGSNIKDITYLYGTLKTSGRVALMDMNQFAGRGIPIWETLAKRLNKTTAEVRGLVSAGKIGFKDIEGAFKDMTKEGGQFFHLMDDQSKTVGGQLSNMADSWEQLKVEIGKSQKGIIAGTVSFFSGMVDMATKHMTNSNNREAAYKKYGATDFGTYAKTNERLSSFLGVETPVSQQYESEDYLRKMTNVGGIKTSLQAKSTEVDLRSLLKNTYDQFLNKWISKDKLDKDQAVIRSLIDETKGVYDLMKTKEDKTKKDKAGSGGALDKDSSKVKQQQYTNITINIHDGLVHEFNVNTATIEGGAQNAKAIVLKGLIEAVNDSQIVARN